MNRVLSTLLVVLFASGWLHAQSIPAKSRLSADLALSAGAGQYAVHAWASNLHFLGKKRKFGIGYGIRWNSYFGTDQNFTSAPPEFVGKEDKEATLTVANAQINSLNLAIFLQYNFSEKFDVGFNIDALGFSFGGEQDAKFKAAGSTQDQTEKASPTSTNLLLVGANDRGSLNSEFFARYWFTQNLGVKLAFTYFFLEYTTNRPIAANDNNDRFRNSATMGSIGITWKIK